MPRHKEQGRPDLDGRKIRGRARLGVHGGPALKRSLSRAKMVNEYDIDSSAYVIEGANFNDSQDAVQLSMGGELLQVGEVAIPVYETMRVVPSLVQVGVSWKSTDDPGGPWVLTLWHKPSGGTFSPVATTQVATS